MTRLILTLFVLITSMSAFAIERCFETIYRGKFWLEYSDERKSTDEIYYGDFVASDELWGAAVLISTYGGDDIAENRAELNRNLKKAYKTGKGLCFEGLVLKKAPLYTFKKLTTFSGVYYVFNFDRSWVADY